MKTLHYLALVCILLLSLAASCNKPEPEPEQQLPSGENTMYYYIDGVLFIPKADSNGGIYTPAIRRYICNINSPTFQISANNGVLIHFYNGLTNEGEIVLNQSNYDDCYVNDNHSNIAKSELWNDGIYHTTWYYTHDGSGFVNILFLSEDKKHFKGTFSMTLYHENTNKEIQITDGHFNINLNTLNQ